MHHPSHKIKFVLHCLSVTKIPTAAQTKSRLLILRFPLTVSHSHSPLRLWVYPHRCLSGNRQANDRPSKNFTSYNPQRDCWLTLGGKGHHRFSDLRTCACVYMCANQHKSQKQHDTWYHKVSCDFFSRGMIPTNRMCMSSREREWEKCDFSIL